MINVNADNSAAGAAINNKNSSGIGSMQGAGDVRNPGKIIKASDLSFTIGSAVSDMSDYNSQLKDKEDIMKIAGAGDVTTMQNYMTVMAHSVSDEDFGRMMKEGFDPNETDIKVGAGIVEEIKATMAKAGVVIEGYNDDLSREELVEITGSEAMAVAIENAFRKEDVPMTRENVKDAAQVIERAGEIEEITDGMCDYLLRNGIEPTYDYLYRVRYTGAQTMGSSGGYINEDVSGYQSYQASGASMEGLEKRIAATIENAGLEVNEMTKTESRFLIENGIIYNEDNLTRLDNLWKMNPPFTMEDTAASVAAAIASGRKASEATPEIQGNLLERALKIKEDMDSFTEKEIAEVVNSGKILNIENLRAVQTADNINSNAALNLNTVSANTDSPEVIRAARICAEARLTMSIRGNYRMLKMGISVETTAISELVNTLKALEDEKNRALFGNDGATEELIASRAALYKETNREVLEIPFMPAASIGEALSGGGTFTMSAVYKAGVAITERVKDAAGNDYERITEADLAERFKNATNTYEAVGTQVRKDLGDSIRKAFAGVDDILSGMNLEESDENRRAVRILGYSSMEITAENITLVKEKDAELNRVLKKMTPAAVLELIRDDVNPLTVSMEELESRLDSRYESAVSKAEDYASFLYKLDKRGDISQSERDSFIGIYRLINRFEKNDDAAVGTLVKAGADINFKNLLTAMRTTKSEGMDIVLDDSFGAAVEESGYSFSISEQIMSKFTEIATAKPDEAQVKEMAEEFRNSLTDKADALEELMHYGMDITPANLEAFDEMLKAVPENDPWKLLGGLNDKQTKESKEVRDEKSFTDSVKKLQNSFTSKDSIKEAFEDVIKASENVLNDAVGAEGVTQIDLKAATSAFKRIRLMGNLLSEENYEVPVYIEGNLTGMRVKIIHKSADSGNVMSTINTEKYGEIMAQFSFRNGELGGLIAGRDEDGLKSLKESGRIEKAFEEAGIPVGDIKYIASETLDTGVFYRSHTANDSVSVKELYKVAGTLIGAMGDY